MSIYISCFLFTIIAYGITNLFVFMNGPFHIFSLIREGAGAISKSLGELFDCPCCFGTWTGLVLSLCDVFFLKDFAITPFSLILGSQEPWWLICGLDMLYASSTVWLLHNIEERLEK